MTLLPTRRQALGRGAYLGSLVGAGLCVLAGVLVGVASLVHLDLPGRVAALVPLISLALGAVVGAVVGLLRGRQHGNHVDDLGIHASPRGTGRPMAWQWITDLRPERRGGRTRVAVYLDSGPIGWLRAPYSGRLLATDPEFEHKLFMLRHLWATHRRAGLRHHPYSHQQVPVEDV